MSTPLPAALPFRDAAHAKMQREYIHSMQAQGWTLFGTEVPYSNGHGFVDVVLFTEGAVGPGRLWLVAELKPTVQNIGEAIRQVRRAQQSFFRSYPDLLKGQSREAACRFPLVVLASEENWRRCAAYATLFAGIELELFHPDHVRQRDARNKSEIECAILEAGRSTRRLTCAEKEEASGSTACCPGSIPEAYPDRLRDARSRHLGPDRTCAQRH